MTIHIRFMIPKADTSTRDRKQISICWSQCGGETGNGVHGYGGGWQKIFQTYIVAMFTQINEYTKDIK